MPITTDEPDFGHPDYLKLKEVRYKLRMSNNVWVNISINIRLEILIGFTRKCWASANSINKREDIFRWVFLANSIQTNNFLNTAWKYVNQMGSCLWFSTEKIGVGGKAREVWKISLKQCPLFAIFLQVEAESNEDPPWKRSIGGEDTNILLMIS